MIVAQPASRPLTRDGECDRVARLFGMEQELVSIVIPARNRGPYVVETLGLLAEQTFPAARTEVVLVDDGSSDGTAALVGQRDYPFELRIERLAPTQEPFWAARPRNAGLRAARAEIVVLLDSDVFVNQRFVEAHVRLHANRPTGAPPAVGIGYLYGTAFDNEERTAGRLKPPSVEELARLVALEQRPPAGWKEGRPDYAAAWPELRTCPAPWVFFWTGNVSFRVDTLGGEAAFDEDFRGWGGEDTDLGYRLFRDGAEYHWLPEAWAVHYPHPVRPAMEGEVKRNCQRIIAKYPDAMVEAVLWSLRFADPADVAAGLTPEAWRVTVIQQIDDARRRAGTVPPLPATVVDAVRAAPMLWCGPRPAGLGPDAVHSDAFATGATAEAPALLGLATPWPDRRFAVAVADHYWTVLPPAFLPALVRELSRLAPTVWLILRPTPDAAAVIERTSALLGAPAPLDQAIAWRIQAGR
jgi:glycosyltransferase involved in cell wall biosynthesis